MAQTTQVYALRAAIELAYAYPTDGLLLSAATVAELADLPRAYGEALVNRMGKSPFLAAARGSRGGYRLTRPPKDITVADILRSVDGLGPPSICAIEDGPCPRCRGPQGCKVLPVFIAAHQAEIQSFEQLTLADLLADAA